MEKTIVIQIGNTDDKLTQVEWRDYVSQVNEFIHTWADRVHFFGAPPNYERWQNAAWIITCLPKNSGKLHSEVIRIRRDFRQDSIAWMEGETQFV